jgi:upstream activation factor subunit UAF30
MAKNQAPPKTKQTKEKKSKTTKESVTSSKVPAQTLEPVVHTPEPQVVSPQSPLPEAPNEPLGTGGDVSWSKYSENFTSIINDLQNWRCNITGMIATVRNLQRSVEKELKHTSKRSRKYAQKSKREPSGFAKPTVISHDLCDFLAKPYGTEMARTEVTKYLTQYIKQHELQEPQDKRKINPDPKLSKLLGCSNSDEVTYFNLQKWMKPHFSSAQSISPE